MLRGTLEAAIRETTERAVQSGTLLPIANEQHRITDDGVEFVVRVASALKRKAEARPPAQGPQKNPFLAPYEPDLFVGELTRTHVVLLNKFNVFAEHALILTREYEAQDALMTKADFEALLICLGEVDGLAFYNSGPLSGFSQPHRHLQLVPTPLVDPPLRTPMDPLVLARRTPFPAAVSELPAGVDSAHAHYLDLLRQLGRAHDGASYNLLATREWMMVVPRTRECFNDISLNALAFAGSLFVKSPEQFEQVREAGPIAVLRSVTT